MENFCCSYLRLFGLAWNPSMITGLLSLSLIWAIMHLSLLSFGRIFFSLWAHWHLLYPFLYRWPRGHSWFWLDFFVHCIGPSMEVTCYLMGLQSQGLWQYPVRLLVETWLREVFWLLIYYRGHFCAFIIPTTFNVTESVESVEFSLFLFFSCRNQWWVFVIEEGWHDHFSVCGILTLAGSGEEPTEMSGSDWDSIRQ